MISDIMTPYARRVLPSFQEQKFQRLAACSDSPFNLLKHQSGQTLPALKFKFSALRSPKILQGEQEPRAGRLAPC